MVIQILCLLLSSYISSISFASEPAIPCEVHLSGDSASPRITPFGDMRQSFGYRGHIAYAVDNNPELLQKAFAPIPAINIKSPESLGTAIQYGIMEWATRIFVVNSFQEAVVHDSSNSNVLMKGCYVLGDGKAVSALSKDNQWALFKAALSEGLYCFEQTGWKKYIFSNDAEILKRFNPLSLNFSYSEKWQLYGFLQEGWFYPQIRGILHYQHTQGSHTYKDLRRKTRAIVSNGYKIKLNSAFAQAMEILAEQSRKGQDPSLNRFSSAEFRKSLVEMNLAGKALTAEFFDPNNKLLGGILILRNGNVFMPDSVFYTDGPGNIDYAKYALVGFLDRLAKAGIPFVDVGMVTPFTKFMKGIEIPSSIFETILPHIPSDAVVDLNSEWSSAESEEAKTIDFSNHPSFTLIPKAIK